MGRLQKSWAFLVPLAAAGGLSLVLMARADSPNRQPNPQPNPPPAKPGDNASSPQGNVSGTNGNAGKNAANSSANGQRRYTYIYPTPYYSSPYYMLPPVYAPPDAFYPTQGSTPYSGMGWGSFAPPDVSAIPRANAENGPLRRDAPELANEFAASAWKNIARGDDYFGDQKYTDAISRYRQASETAPKLADAWFRQGFAQTALGRYEAAAKAIKRGLVFNPRWKNSDFRLDAIYGDNKIAKNAHLEALAQAAEDKPNNADLLFLVGVYLHFDGQPNRAVPFFQRAEQLAGDDAGHVKAFLGN